MLKNNFIVFLVSVFLLHGCTQNGNQQGFAQPESPNAPEAIAPVDNPDLIAKQLLESWCQQLSQGYLAIINFQKVDAVRAKNMAGIEYYKLTCSYQVKGLKNGGFLEQCRIDSKLQGFTVAFAQNTYDCFNFPVEEGKVYELDRVNMGNFRNNFEIYLEKHENGWVNVQ